MSPPAAGKAPPDTDADNPRRGHPPPAALEEELKAQLCVRDKQTTELTPAGRQLLTDAGPLLASADALRQRVTRAARGPRSFTMGFMPGLIVTEAVRPSPAGPNRTASHPPGPQTPTQIPAQAGTRRVQQAG
jgi:hypothetical protein